MLAPPYSFFIGIVIGSINGLMDSEPIGDYGFITKHTCMLHVILNDDKKDSLS